MSFFLVNPYIFGTTLGSGFTFIIQTAGGGATFTMPVGATINALVDWGDGNSDVITSNVDPALVHPYSGAAGDYTIRVTGSLSDCSFFGTPNSEDIKHVLQLGEMGWTSLADMFRGSSNLESFNVGRVSGQPTSVSFMFSGADALAGHIDLSAIDTTLTTTIAGLMLGNALVTSVTVDLTLATTMSAVLDAFRDCATLTTVNLIGLSNVDTAQRMFSATPNIVEVLGIEDWIIGDSTQWTSFMTEPTASIPTATYDQMLINWAAQNPTFDGTVPMGGSLYTTTGAAARQSLIDAGFVITDGGQVPVDHGGALIGGYDLTDPALVTVVNPNVDEQITAIAPAWSTGGPILDDVIGTIEYDRAGNFVQTPASSGGNGAGKAYAFPSDAWSGFVVWRVPAGAATANSSSSILGAYSSTASAGETSNVGALSPYASTDGHIGEWASDPNGAMDYPIGTVVPDTWYISGLTSDGVAEVGIKTQYLNDLTPKSATRDSGAVIAPDIVSIGRGRRNIPSAQIKGYAVYDRELTQLEAAETIAWLKGAFAVEYVGLLPESGLVVHLEADDPANFVLEDTDRIVQWTDTSGEGNHATAATGNVRRPFYDAARGLIALNKSDGDDGTTKYLAFANEANLKTVKSMYLVSGMPGISSNGGGGWGGYMDIIGHPGTSGTRWATDTGVNEDWNNIAGADNIWVNGVEQLSTDSVFPLDPDFNIFEINDAATTPVLAGLFSAGAGNNQQWQGNTFAFLAYDRVLTTGEQENIRTYLTTKYTP